MATSLAAPPKAEHGHGDGTGAALALLGLGAAGVGGWLLWQHAHRPAPGHQPAPGPAPAKTGTFTWNGTNYHWIITADANEAAAYFWPNTDESDRNSRLAFFNPNPKRCPFPGGQLFWTAPDGVPTWQPGVVAAWWAAHIYTGPLPSFCG